jgi:hypothetical protein
VVGIEAADKQVPLADGDSVSSTPSARATLSRGLETGRSDSPTRQQDPCMPNDVSCNFNTYSVADLRPKATARCDDVYGADPHDIEWAFQAHTLHLSSGGRSLRPSFAGSYIHIPSSQKVNSRSPTGESRQCLTAASRAALRAVAAIGSADPRPGDHSQGFGACEDAWIAERLEHGIAPARDPHRPGRATGAGPGGLPGAP